MSQTVTHIFLLGATSLFLILATGCSRKDNEAELPDSSGSNAAANMPREVSFNAHIRPILSDKCFACHGFDAKTREADLRLDIAEGAYAPLKESEGYGIVPGALDKSAVWDRITTTDPDKLMPPEKFHKPLTERERLLIKAWIEQGAVYEKHWAYQPIKKPSLPSGLKHQDQVVNAIDSFIFSRLESEGLSPERHADKSTLLRRLSLDLTGIPPTPEELEAFLNDTSPQAYERQVDRLLQSPRYGERMAVVWLDVARYADTVGFHGDQNQHIFPYRDYVIDAYNSNKTFDQFTIEQLAGDLLEDPTPEQLVATGFIRLSQMTREGGAQPKEYLAKYASDRVRAIGGAWLGLTTGCAECHDHKFDPITAKDFYSLSAFFKDIKQWGVYANYGYTPNPDLRGFNNNYPFPPEILTESTSLNNKLIHLRNLAHQQNATRAKVTPQWENEVTQYLKKHPTGWAPTAAADVTSSKNTPSVVKSDGTVVFTGKQSQGDHITLTLEPHAGHLTAFRIEVLPDAHHGGKTGRGELGDFAITPPQFQIQTSDQSPPTGLIMAWSQADYHLPEYYVNGHAPLGFPKKLWRTANLLWSLPNDFQTRKHTAVFLLQTPRNIAPGEKIKVSFASNNIGAIRISTTRFGEPVAGKDAAAPELLESLNTPPSERTAAQTNRIRGTWSLAHLSTKQLDPRWPVLQKSIRECRSGIAKSLIALTIPQKEISPTRILPRGNWQDESGEIVEPAVLHFLPQPAETGKRKLTRLDLAKWIVSDQNPLTARHVVNRYWKQFFGNGLSNVLDDLGSQGEWPSHPLLLDWLAHEFRSSGWDTKHIIKLIVMSHTYRQKSGTLEKLKDIDPYNRLLAGQSARRLDAEFVRDNALAIAGLIQTNYTGGPSVFPYQPPGYYAPLQFPNRTYLPSVNNDQYRRSVYMHWQRTFLHPMLANFDAPSREECTADRLQSNSPLQALTLLNDPASFEMARSFARKLLEDKSNLNDRLDLAWLRTLSRKPRDDERASIKAFYEQQLEHYRKATSDTQALLGQRTPPAGVKPEEFAAWTQVCRVLLNLHETITRY